MRVLVVLCTVWAAMLFGGYALGRPDAGGRRLPTWARIGSSAALVLAAWVGYGSLRGGQLAGLALLLAGGMSLGLLGDLFMAGLLPVSQPVLGGMAAFALGHVAYCVAFLGLGRLLAQPPALRLAAWAVWLAVGLLGWYVVVFRGARQGEHSPLHWAALPYSLLLASTAGLANGLALLRPVFLFTGLGGALFLISDMLIAWQLFRQARWRWLDDAIWLTYGPAQMLIVYSVWLAARALGA